MMTLGTLLASFRRDLKALRKSPRTIDIYTLGVTLFCEFLESPPDEVPLGDLSRVNLKQWVRAAPERGWKPNTIRTHFSGVSRFGNWLVAEEYLDENPATSVTLPVERDYSPAIITDDELKKLLDLCKGRDFISRRDAAMIRVFLDTGVRAAELCGMKVSATDLDNEVTLVTGKGDKIRPVYFSSKTVAALDRYIRARASHRHAKLDDLWLTQRGPMSAKATRDRIAQIGVEAGVPGLHPHRFRHTWAHDHLLHETSTVDLKRLAGWSSDAMLSRYGASGADTRAAAAARRASRGDRV